MFLFQIVQQNSCPEQYFVHEENQAMLEFCIREDWGFQLM